MGAFVFVLEMIGTVAFAASGALLAIRKKMDMAVLFAICCLAPHHPQHFEIRFMQLQLRSFQPLSLFGLYVTI